MEYGGRVDQSAQLRRSQQFQGVTHLRVRRSTSAWYCFSKGPAAFDTSGVTMLRKVRVPCARSLLLTTVSSWNSATSIAASSMPFRLPSRSKSAKNTNSRF
jgi:hypothetical protein